MMQRVSHVLVHTADALFGTAAILDRWHREKGYEHGIGYHYVIRNGHAAKGDAYSSATDGLVEAGRPESMRGYGVPVEKVIGHCESPTQRAVRDVVRGALSKAAHATWSELASVPLDGGALARRP